MDSKPTRKGMDRDASQDDLDLGNTATAGDAMQFAKRKILLLRVPIMVVLGLIVVVTVYGWQSASSFTRVGVVLFIILVTADVVRLTWLECRDPALGTVRHGILEFHWISGRSVKVPTSRLRRVRVHANPYWQFRRVYPKWFEVEIEREPKRIIVPDSNLKPEARELLTRMSGSAQ